MNPESLKYYSHPKMQEKFREKMGTELHEREWIYCKRCQEAEVLGIHSEYCMEELDDLIRLPLPIDPRNPERGLWGMVDWVDWHLETLATGECYISANFSDKQYGFSGTPELALLKALSYQWDVEVTP